MVRLPAELAALLDAKAGLSADGRATAKRCKNAQGIGVYHVSQQAWREAGLNHDARQIGLTQVNALFGRDGFSVPFPTGPPR